jgi:co-chaperonin GroES (HSP10)
MIHRENFKPNFNRVEIERIPDRTVIGSIIKPDRAIEDAFMRGRVFAVGDGYDHHGRKRVDGKWTPTKTRVECPVKVGEEVVFAESEKTMHQTMVNGHHVVPFDRVWGVLEE